MGYFDSVLFGIWNWSGMTSLFKSVSALELASRYELFWFVPERTGNPREEVMILQSPSSNSNTSILFGIWSWIGMASLFNSVFSSRTHLSVWLILICAGAGSQPAGGGHDSPVLQQQFKHIDSLQIWRWSGMTSLFNPTPITHPRAYQNTRSKNHWVLFNNPYSKIKFSSLASVYKKCVFDRNSRAACAARSDAS